MNQCERRRCVYILSEEGKIPTRKSVTAMVDKGIPLNNKDNLLIRAGSKFLNKDLLFRLLRNQDFVVVISPDKSGINVFNGRKYAVILCKSGNRDSWECGVDYLEKLNKKRERSNQR